MSAIDVLTGLRNGTCKLNKCSIKIMMHTQLHLANTSIIFFTNGVSFEPV